MRYAEALKKLSSIGEEALLDNYASLSNSAQTHLLDDINLLCVDTFRSQQGFLRRQLPKSAKNEKIINEFLPFCNPDKMGSAVRKARGLELIAAGKVGCLIVAGGQGTRLSFDGPKGTFPITLFKMKSLFQLFAERALAAGKQVNRVLPLAIMTSPQNHLATVQFFTDHDNFGLHAEQLSFFMQEELPFLDEAGHLILLDQETIAKGPTGNGSSLDHFIKSGIWEKWIQQGVEFLNFILVDNPLADPFDAELIGFHQENDCDVTIKCIERSSASEQAGFLVETNQGIEIVEYSEIDARESVALLPDGTLKHRFINSGLYCFSMAFIKRAVDEMTLPWHLAYKSIGNQSSKGWKFETFIFDYFEMSKKTQGLLYPREYCFAPLKNSTGDSGIDKVQEALLKSDLRVLEEVVGQKISTSPIELDLQFYYPTPEILSLWKGKLGPFSGYIRPIVKG